jgi:hypothetical protein
LLLCAGLSRKLQKLGVDGLSLFCGGYWFRVFVRRTIFVVANKFTDFLTGFVRQWVAGNYKVKMYWLVYLHEVNLRKISRFVNQSPS